MYCASFCAAKNYKLDAIYAFLKTQSYSIKIYRNIALHAHKPKTEENIFIFSHGCFVTWGLDENQEKQLLSDLNLFAVDRLSSIESNRFTVRRGDKTELSVHKHSNLDIINLSTDEAEVKLAISYGLAQSIKLESYETIIQNTIQKNAYLAEELAKQGTIPLSRKAILKRIGEIFIVRSYINLNSEYLDVPEYFWENPGIEDYYTLCEKFLDIRRRVSTLNQKLDVLQELFDILNNQLQHRHSVFLEATIIVLIFIEIIITLIFYH